MDFLILLRLNKVVKLEQVVIAQWLAQQLVAGVVPSSNPGKGENLLNSD